MKAKWLYAVMALVWFLVGAGLMARDWKAGVPQWFQPVRPGGLSQGWFAWLFCVWCVFRVLTHRSREVSRQAREPSRLQQHRRPRGEDGPPNPDFDFTDRRPPPPSVN